MKTIGVTGHQRIPPIALPYVIEGIKRQLVAAAGPVTGYSSLAIGSDQVFAQELLAAGGRLVAVIPCRGYEHTFDKEGRATYDGLLAVAAQIVVLDFAEPSEAAFMAAGTEVIDRSDVLIAIWDGEPARGLGGTADAVAYANSQGREVVVIWPEGVER